jgi:hypothetical protein
MLLLHAAAAAVPAPAATTFPTPSFAPITTTRPFSPSHSFPCGLELHVKPNAWPAPTCISSTPHMHTRSVTPPSSTAPPSPPTSLSSPSVSATAALTSSAVPSSTLTTLAAATLAAATYTEGMDTNCST